MNIIEKNVSIISNNQSGGITAHTVNIETAPEPKIVWLQEKTINENEKIGENYRTCVPFEIDSPYPPGNLRLSVSTPSINRSK